MGINSLEVGVSILKIIGQSEHPLSIGEIAQHSHMTKSHVHRYLTSLHRTGLIRRDRELRYSLGLDLMTLGLNALKQFDISELARPTLIRLREQFNETVALSVWTEGGPYYLSWVESQRVVNVGIRVGAQVSAVKSAGGKVFLAFLPQSETYQLVEKECAESGLDRDAFETELVTIRHQGYSTTEESLLPGIVSVGCPVFGPAGRIVAAITVVGILGQLAVGDQAPVVTSLMAECSQLSQVLAG